MVIYAEFIISIRIQKFNQMEETGKSLEKLIDKKKGQI